MNGAGALGCLAACGLVSGGLVSGGLVKLWGGIA